MRDYAGTFSPDTNGRPVQLNVWYPAGGKVPGQPMTYGDYVDRTAPREFAEIGSIMRNRDLENSRSSVAPDQLAALLSTFVNAHFEAPPEVGHFPMVLYFGGMNAEVNSNFILAEFLASHGYVAASISLLGPSDQQPSQGRTALDFAAIVRDMEFGSAVLAEGTNVDRTKMAVMGHSLGGIEAAMFGLRKGNVQAVIALDGTYGFKGSGGLLTNTYGYASGKMRAAFLDLRRAQGAQGAELDLGTVLSFRFADRTLVTLAKMHHSDFTSFAMLASVFHVPEKSDYAKTGWNRETGRSGYENACRIILGFLDEKLKGDHRGHELFRESIRQADGGFTHLEASFAPPSPREVVALAEKEGVTAVKSIFTKIAGNQPVATCLDAGSFNAFGYDLLGQHRSKDALVIFEIATWAHPTSANAQDSLADGYLSIGDKTNARAAIQQAIDLAPADPTMDRDSKAAFVKDEGLRLEQLK